MWRIIVRLALVLCVPGCAFVRGAHENDSAGERSRPDSVIVVLLNENYYAARVHAVYAGGQRRPLGTIPGNGGHARVTIPWEPRA